MIPVNPVRLALIVRVWPISLALYMVASLLYGSGGDRHPLGDSIFDTVSATSAVLLAATALCPWRLRLRALAGLGVVGATLLRATWLLDPGFIANQRLLAASIYLVVAVSTIGWVMSADYAVVTTQMQREAARLNGGAP